MKHHRLYIWQCGHSTHDKVNYGGKNYLVCPKCKKGCIMAVRLWCHRCGEEMGVFAAKYSSRKFCEPCRGAIKKESNAAPNKKDKPLSKDALAARCMKYPDCRFYLVKCLPEALAAKKDFACSGCRHYWPKPLDIKDFVKCESPLAMAADMHPVYSNLGPGVKRGVNTLEIALAKG